MIITRQLINQNIKFHDYGIPNNHHRYDYLSKLIDSYKNLLLSKGANSGMNAVIGSEPSTAQIAIVFACAELGLTITITNELSPAGHYKYQPNFINPKLNLLLPIDFFITNIYYPFNSKHRILKEKANQTVVISDHVLDYSVNNIILANKSNIFLKCLTSGTTGTPKVIEHTHEFLYELVLRNSKFYYGNMAAIRNLNHGSSPATYFLPGLASKNVKYYFNVVDASPLHLLKDLQDALNHIMIPYTNMLDNIFSTDIIFKNCIFYTLSTIRNEWVSEVKKGRAKDIISIFGSNETSGPILINQASDIDFTEDTYKIVDDFYGISVNDKSELLVQVPIYNKSVCTNDKIEILDSKVRYIGRSNLFRINDLEIDVGFYQQEIKKYMNADLVIDTNKNRLYLAIWDNIENKDVIKNIDDLLKNNSNGLHHISSFECLNYQDFLSGIKLDNESLREYFREKVSPN